MSLTGNSLDTPDARNGAGNNNKALAAFKKRLAKRLGVWSVSSIAVGIVLLALFAALGESGAAGIGIGAARASAAPWSFLWGIAVNAVAWGAVDLMLVAFTALPGRRKGRSKGRNEGDSKKRKRGPAATLRRVLYVNGGLDVGYILGGAVVILVSRGGLVLAGVGIGIVIQGAFLLVFDFYHAPRVPVEHTPPVTLDRAPDTPEDNRSKDR